MSFYVPFFFKFLNYDLNIFMKMKFTGTIERLEKFPWQ